MDEDSNKKRKIAIPSDLVPAIVHVPSDVSEKRDLKQDATEQPNKVLLEREETIRHLREKNETFLQFMNDKILKFNASVRRNRNRVTNMRSQVKQLEKKVATLTEKLEQRRDMCRKLRADLHHSEHDLMVEKLQHKKTYRHFCSAVDKVKNLMQGGSVCSNSTIDETQSEQWQRIGIGSDEPGCFDYYSSSSDEEET